jgi:phytanoyl-CoA hydroxylase
MLSDIEIARFWEDGYLVINDVFTPAEVELLRGVTEGPRIQKDLNDRRAEERIVHLIPLTPIDRAFKELARDTRIAARVARLIGDDVQLQHSKLATKPRKKGAGAFDWHQDFAYFPHTNYDLVSVGVALDDATPENGGMYALKGSHKEGLRDHMRDGWMVGACQETRLWEGQPDRVVPLMAKAGGITIHHCLTLHGSPVNRCGSQRRLVVFQYRAGHAYQLADHVWADTGFQVHGTPSHRVKCVEMDVVLPKNRGWQRYCGEPHGDVYKQIGATARQWNDEANAKGHAEPAVAPDAVA